MDELVPSPPSSKCNRILIVDDERVILAVVGRQFEQWGYQVTLVSNGREALDVLKKQRVDLVLLDVVMPEMDGWEVLRSIRICYDEFRLPIIMFTATEDRYEIVRMFEAGANDYVSKPFDSQITRARVETQLRLKKAQNQVSLSEERYALAARATNDGLWDWDIDTGIIYFSPRWRQLVGLSEVEFHGSYDDWRERVHIDDIDKLNCILQSIRQGKSFQFDTEFRIRHETGSYRWIICRGVAVTDSTGRTHRIAGSITDITGGKVADVLTGLPNRLLFRERMSRCIDEFRENISRPCAVIYLDLDNFKFINDTFGHVAGDQVLVTAAKRLERVISSLSMDAVAARFGGDEFAVLVENVESIDEIIACANEIHTSMFRPIRVVEDREVYTQASVGIAVLDENTSCADALLSHADIAMYDAKSQGKSRTSIFDLSMRQRFEARLSMETELRKAIQNNSFRLEYQPIYDIFKNEIIGFEALMRWSHFELGDLSPYDFIPLAEELNVIQQLGEWMIDEVCQQIAAWTILLPSPLSLFVSINISSKQFAQSDFVDRMLRAVSNAGIECNSLKLEITESVIVKNLNQASEMIRCLQSHGFRVAIDDFGTGFSSLAYLHQLPLNILKVDKSFVQRIDDSVSGSPIVNTILTLASNLKLAAIAEGVETEVQLAELKRLGCRYAQGFLLSPPISPEEATRCLTTYGALEKNGIAGRSIEFLQHKIRSTNLPELVTSLFRSKESNQVKQ